MAVRRVILNWAHSRNYSVLLGSLIFVMGTWSFIGEDTWIGLLMQIGFTVMMASALFACFRTRSAFVVGLLLGVGAQVCQGVGEIWEIDAAIFAASGLKVLFFGMVTYGVLADVVTSRKVTMRVVAGACSVYLLLAITFGTVFTLLEHVWPGSFSFGDVYVSEIEAGYAHETRSAILSYYSLITITTVGYGDVTPASPAARGLSALEGVIGQLFIAVFLARFVALEISTRMRDENKPS